MRALGSTEPIPGGKGYEAVGSVTCAAIAAYAIADAMHQVETHAPEAAQSAVVLGLFAGGFIIGSIRKAYVFFGPQT